MEKVMPFKVVESDENSVVLEKTNATGKIVRKHKEQRINSKKRFKVIIPKLPTARVHFFDYNDYLNLKEIEKEILDELAKRKESFNFIGRFKSFFEL